MGEVKESTLKKAHKPFDIVTNNAGDVGIIQEVYVNDCQEGFNTEIKYAVTWLVGKATKHAWFYHEELTVHCNMFIKIAEMSCHPSGSNSYWVKRLMGNK